MDLFNPFSPFYDFPVPTPQDQDFPDLEDVECFEDSETMLREINDPNYLKKPCKIPITISNGSSSNLYGSVNDIGGGDDWDALHPQTPHLSAVLGPWEHLINPSPPPFQPPSPTVNQLMKNSALRCAYHAKHALRDLRSRAAEMDPAKGFKAGMAFRINDLATELRLRIYKLVVVCSEPIDTKSTHKYKRNNWIPPPLLAVSRQVRDEAGQVYYAQNEFKVTLKCSMFGDGWAYVPTKLVTRWADRIGTKQASHLRRITVHFDIENLKTIKTISVAAKPAVKSLSVTSTDEHLSERAQMSIFKLQADVEQRMKDNAVTANAALDFFTLDADAFEFEIIGNKERTAKGGFTEEQLRD